MQNYAKVLNDLRWEDWSRIICGKKWNTDKPQFFSYSGRCDAIFVSYDKDLIKKYKDHVRKHCRWNAIIGLANLTKKGWEIDLGNIKFTIPMKKAIPLADKWESPQQRRLREEREYAEAQARAQREREERRIALREAERIRREREEVIAKSLSTKIENGEVSERPSAQELWRKFYMNETNSSWWQDPESIAPRSTVEVGVTHTN
jgi:hypothetical protein